MNKERLLKLAELLESLPRKHVRKFDMNDWCVCGTTVCAVGEAAFDPWFRRRGLRLQQGDGSLKYPVYRGFFGFDACEQFFSIHGPDAGFLFEANSYPPSRRGPKSVANRIRSFVARGGQS